MATALGVRLTDRVVARLALVTALAFSMTPLAFAGLKIALVLSKRNRWFWDGQKGLSALSEVIRMLLKET